jgi:hypothetical protein
MVFASYRESRFGGNPGERVKDSSMIHFAIIEVADGLTIVELQPGQDPQDAAVAQSGVLVDPGPYASYEEANDALIDLQSEDDDLSAADDESE